MERLEECSSVGCERFGRDDEIQMYLAGTLGARVSLAVVVVSGGASAATDELTKADVKNQSVSSSTAIGNSLDPHRNDPSEWYVNLSVRWISRE